MDQDEGQGGSPKASLVAEHVGAISRVCMALLGDPGDTSFALEQIAREVGTKRGPPEGVSARGFIFGLARAACATRMSKMPLRGAGGANVTGGHLPEAPPTGDAANARALLAKLKPTEREAVALHAVGGLDAEDVAVACGVDLPTARARIGQGMTRLAELVTASAEGGSR